ERKPRIYLPATCKGGHESGSNPTDGSVSVTHGEIASSLTPRNDNNLRGHCEPTGPRSARPEDRLREVISIRLFSVPSVRSGPLACCQRPAGSTGGLRCRSDGMASGDGAAFQPNGVLQLLSASTAPVCAS